MKSIFKILFCTLLILVSASYAQDLTKERIRKLTGSKTSIYIEKGIFHNGGVKQESSIKSIRQFYNPKQGFERIVIDFSSSQIPKVYGNVSALDKKIYIDFFDTSLASDFKPVSNTKYVEKVNVFPIEANYLSLEFKMRAHITADIFFLENPGRLVIDLKN